MLDPLVASVADDLAVKLFGGIPMGRLFGMAVLVDPSMPDDRIRFVDPVTGRFSDFPLPKT
jgi:hypothetical protein